MRNSYHVPDYKLDPPDEPELPEADGTCDLCGQDKWSDVELDRDGDCIAHCLTEIDCPECEGDGKATDSPEEGVALTLMSENKCKTCGGSGKITCEGTWTKVMSPPDPPERDDD